MLLSFFLSFFLFALRIHLQSSISNHQSSSPIFRFHFHSKETKMEFEEAHNNLRAIRLLYKLLHDNYNQLLQNHSSDSDSHHLIERARGLLKSLLDVAVVSVFQTHLKIIATPSGISNTSFDQEKSMPMLQFEPQCSVKDPTLSEMPSLEDEQPHLRLIPEIEFPSSEKGISPNKESKHYEQQHNQVDDSDGVGVQARESLQMLEGKVGESNNEDKKMPLMGRVDEFQYNSSAASHVESPDQKGDFSDDLLNAMKRIESRMFALQLCSNLADSTKNNADHHQTMHEEATSDSSNMQGKDEIEVSQNHRLNTNAVSAKNKIDTPNQNRTQDLSKAKSLNRLVSCNNYLRTQASDHIQDLKVPLNQDDLITRKPSKLSDHRNRKSLVRKNPVVWSESDHNQKKMSPENSNTQKKPVRSTGSNIARRQKPQPHHMVIRPTLLDQKSSEIKVFSHHRREGSAHVEPWKTRVQPQHQELEESSSNSQSSSSWTSQQVSDNSSSNSEDYSLPKNGTEENSTSETMVDAASYEGSSEESNNSYTSNDDDDDDDDDNSSRRFGSMKSHRYHPKRNPEKKIGGLKRLKNKPGLIFHHHHHHHHHHYDNDDDDNSSIESKRVHNKNSMWNNLQNVFHQKNKHKMLANGKVDKTRRRGKGVARAVVPRGNQVGQFHRLVEGLLRHMKHSKKKKSHKLGEVKGSRNTQKHGKRKKVHWWQMLQQHKGVKMKNRGRVKVGLIGQKSSKRLA